MALFKLPNPESNIRTAGRHGQMPPTQAGPKSLLARPYEQPFQETAMPAPVKVKKKEQEEKPEAENHLQRNLQVKKVPLMKP